MKLLTICALLGFTKAYDIIDTGASKKFNLLSSKTVTTQETFKAAVFDQAPPEQYTAAKVLTRREAVEIVDIELQVYAEQCKIASEAGVDIIVFPEYGLMPRGTSRDTLLPFLEEIPSPHSGINPCTDHPVSNTTYLLHHLSCLARNSSIYLVANMGDVIYCDPKNTACHPSGRLQFNTNVIFDPQGKLIARYHKKNLFFEFKYDTPVTTDYSYIDTPFGRLGTFICFDILFEKPPLMLVNEYQVDHILFPTAWMNVYPYFSAVPFHQSFAIGNGVNLLGANLRDPSKRFSGSGIYASNTTVIFHNDMNSAKSKLLIGTLPTKPVKIGRQTVQFSPIEEQAHRSPEFTGDVFGDKYNMVLLTKKSDRIMLCHGEVCCHLSYEISQLGGVSSTSDLYALGAFRGLHTKEGTYFIEVCALMICANSTKESCGQTVMHSNTYFQTFNLTGNFTSPYVYPQVTTDGVDPAAGQWYYDGKSIHSNGTNKAFLNAVFFARRYDLDSYNINSKSFATGPSMHCLFVMMSMLLGLLFGNMHRFGLMSI